MSDEKPGEKPETRELETRVREAFDSFDEKLAERLDPDTREYVQKIRDSATQQDAESLRAHMTAVRERHGWLYRELAEHPAVANLLDELALWGF